ncbi:hypothetical protein CCYN2B_190050 [Capnocytophaga cynodegmi]|uniref:Uncharacterized protein n=1 Tax=Capnocytophaga cynodegmi TaxID=28189 RepID=A0A0B7HFK0_9FLAO|nr:hypothetical protein CCYN2B_190050 [Capnocytophaga cynodegmi]CEN36662.1 hypothetical protein CCYN49044_180153 [Capnocytophaga cynodegmi]
MLRKVKFSSVNLKRKQKYVLFYTKKEFPVKESNKYKKIT